MGLKTSVRRGGSLFLVFLLLLNQVIFLGVVSSSESNSQDIKYNICGNPAVPFEPYKPNDVYYDCVDLLVVDDLVIAQNGRVTEFLDISIPSDPYLLGISPTVEYRSSAYTNYGNTILFSLRQDSLFNHSIMKIDLSINSTDYSEIDLWNSWPIHLSLTNDTLYSFSEKNYGYNEFLIHNSTDIHNLTLLGNTTLAGFGYQTDFVVHDDFVYFVSKANNLSVFQINSTYQLSFVNNYIFAQLESIYFHENYLFVCDNFGFQVFDYTNPDNLTSITFYNISSAQTIRIFNDVAYLTTTNSFTTFSLSNIMDIHILDQYKPGKREDVEMWKLELCGNHAIILTEKMKYFDYSSRYGGYLYIFDISSPNKIIRLYPGRIPLRDFWDVLRKLMISAFVVIPTVIILIPLSIFSINLWKKKQQKKKELSLEN